ncbi:hypothetical protein, partial [Lactiplantibacillus pentosus]|uniref:hypothetical protein n=1 Tax=Lactiplantibacillus pentosus TaxID=1589 RepID=UPI002182295F
PAGRYSGQGPVVKFHLASVFGLVSERPVFKTWAVGLNLCPPCSGHCPECLEAGLGRRHNSKFTLSRTFSSGSQLAALELEHVSMINNVTRKNFFKKLQ